MPERALGLVIDRLACPVCQNALTLAGPAVTCGAGHSFDVARQGYVSLFGRGRRGTTGDNGSMVAARGQFLDKGYYLPITRAVSDAIPADAEGLCVDLAGGTGHYLRAVADDHPGLIGLDLDLSTFALRRAARGHTRVAAVGADVWQPLPIRSDAAGYVLSIFGPRNVPEITRILEPSGCLIIVTPTVRHLAELVDRLGLITVDPRKQERLDGQLQDFSRLSHRLIEYTVEMGHGDVLDDVSMGPSAHHVDPVALATKVALLPETFAVTVSVNVSVYRFDRSGRER